MHFTALLFSLVFIPVTFAAPAASPSPTRPYPEAYPEAENPQRPYPEVFPVASPSPSPTAAALPAPEPVIDQSTSAAIRSRKTIGVAAHLSTFDLLVPLKIGGSLSWVINEKTTLEAEYLRARVNGNVFGFDLFDLKDERVSLMARSFAGNSFNFHYGLTYFRFSSRVGSSDFNTGTAVTGFDLVKHRGYGVNAGFGNRWMVNEYVTLGVDWISWAQPLVMKQESSFPEENVKEAVRDDLKLVSYIPRLVFLHLQVGVLF